MKNKKTDNDIENDLDSIKYNKTLHHVEGGRSFFGAIEDCCVCANAVKCSNDICVGFVEIKNIE